MKDQPLYHGFRKPRRSKISGEFLAWAIGFIVLMLAGPWFDSLSQRAHWAIFASVFIAVFTWLLRKCARNVGMTASEYLCTYLLRV